MLCSQNNRNNYYYYSTLKKETFLKPDHMLKLSMGVLRPILFFLCALGKVTPLLWASVPSSKRGMLPSPNEINLGSFVFLLHLGSLQDLSSPTHILAVKALSPTYWTSTEVPRILISLLMRINMYLKILFINTLKNWSNSQVYEVVSESWPPSSHFAPVPQGPSV